MTRHPHRPDWQALLIWTAAFAAIITIAFGTAAAVALIGVME